jgi:hypothetical protein
LRKLHREAVGIAPELPAEQHLDVRFIVNHENKQTHARPPHLEADTAARGSTILNSVNSPGCVSTSIDPPFPNLGDLRAKLAVEVHTVKRLPQFIDKLDGDR